MAVIEALDELEAPQTFNLVVAWTRGKTVDGGDVRFADEIGEHLRSAVTRTIEQLQGREPTDYTADMHLEDEERLEAEDEGFATDSALGQLLIGPKRRKLLNARTLPTKSMLLYAVTFSTAAEGRIAFLRKTNPRPPVRPGRVLGMLGTSLKKLDQPVFALDDFFDLVMTERGIVALNQRVFEGLFKESDAVLESVPAWVQSITDHLPIAGGGAAALAEKCRTDTRLRRRLQAIVERDHLRNVTLERIREHLDELGLPEDRFIENDELIFDEADGFALMALLNEDLFSGGLTGTGFRSDRKSPR